MCSHFIIILFSVYIFPRAQDEYINVLRDQAQRFITCGSNADDSDYDLDDDDDVNDPDYTPRTNGDNASDTDDSADCEQNMTANVEGSVPAQTLRNQGTGRC